MTQSPPFQGRSRGIYKTKEAKPPFLRGVGGILIAIALSLPAIAQQPPAADIRDAWKPVYKQLPNLPLENKYVSRESGKVNSDSTLVNRLIEYHVYVKGRAPNYRLDWKLTLADYLGANELIQDTTYSGAKTLHQNPLEGDRAAINRLNRTQRDALVQSLVNVFTPETSTPPTTNQQPPTNNQQPTTFSQPKPGDADLLK
ncbi:hypothetical protein [Scytonema millei]|uniref:hypothetical protein n=1 Tax=Scytonema millei TaxID=1245922 RepID=UPI000AA4006E|nr:hypothetical protein [Scytonema millei]